MASKNSLIQMGWREWASLPDLGIERIKVKVDTGARTSALHTYFIEPYLTEDDVKRVRFGVHPLQNNRTLQTQCDALVLDERIVTNSGGRREKRFVIETTLMLGDQCRHIELTLTNRNSMKFRMLVGRTAMKGVFSINPGKSFLLGTPLVRHN